MVGEELAGDAVGVAGCAAGDAQEGADGGAGEAEVVAEPDGQDVAGEGEAALAVEPSPLRTALTRARARPRRRWLYRARGWRRTGFPGPQPERSHRRGPCRSARGGSPSPGWQAAGTVQVLARGRAPARGARCSSTQGASRGALSGARCPHEPLERRRRAGRPLPRREPALGRQVRRPPREVVRHVVRDLIGVLLKQAILLPRRHAGNCGERIIRYRIGTARCGTLPGNRGCDWCGHHCFSIRVTSGMLTLGWLSERPRQSLGQIPNPHP
jgi:hypothetical protein